jgi:cleavage and polyadenylation specificity factor subunit 2
MESTSITDDIFDPAEGECVQVSVAKNSYQVVLTESLVSSLRLAQVFLTNELQDYSLSYVSGVVRSEETPQGQRWYLDPVERKQKPTVVVGDIKLSQLNKHLINQGFSTQFAKGGILVVNEKFVVQKGDEGILVRGCLHPEYYALREVVYSFQAMIS